MSYLYAVISPCELTPEQRRATERDYPGLRFPDEGRLPSRRDFEAVFAAHWEWQVELDQGAHWWTASVRGARDSASVYVSHYSGDPTREQGFYFDWGAPELVVEITAALAERCGSFSVAGEGGDIIVMVNPDGSRADVGETPAGGSRPAAPPQGGSVARQSPPPISGALRKKKKRPESCWTARETTEPSSPDVAPSAVASA